MKAGKPLEQAKKMPKAVIINGDNIYGVIKNIRLKKRLSGRALGEELGVTEQGICKWERGKALPKLLNFLDMMNYLGYDVILREREQNET